MTAKMPPSSDDPTPRTPWATSSPHPSSAWPTSFFWSGSSVSNVFSTQARMSS